MITDYLSLQFREPTHILGEFTTAVRAGEFRALLKADKPDHPGPGVLVVQSTGGEERRCWVSLEKISVLEYAAKKPEGK